MLWLKAEEGLLYQGQIQAKRSYNHLCVGITVLHTAITVRNWITSGEPLETALSNPTSVYQW